MIITCPRCTAHYDVEPEHFGLRARLARCSNCGHLWRADPDDFAALPPAAAPAADGASLLPGQESGSSPPPAPTDAGDWKDGDPFTPEPPQSEPPQSEPLWQTLTPPASPVVSPADPPPAAAALDDDAADATASEMAGDPTDDAEPETDQVSSPSQAAATIADSVTATTQARLRRRRLVVAAAAAATAVLCLAALLALQTPITRAIPGMAALYHLAGLAPPPPGADLDIAEVSSSREWADGDDVLIISGSVTNTATDARSLPPLRVTLFDAADRQVQESIVEAEKPVLAAKETVHFTVRIVSPASSARRMVVSFDTTATEAS